MVKGLSLYTKSEIKAPFRDIGRSSEQSRADGMIAGLTQISKTMMLNAGVYDGDVEGGPFDRLRASADPVPDGIDGMRLNLEKKHIEVTAGDEIVEILNPLDIKHYGDRLEAINAALDIRRERMFKKAVRRVGRESEFYLDRHDRRQQLDMINQKRADQLFEFNRVAGGNLVLQKPTASKTQTVLDCVVTGDIAGLDKDLDRFRELFAADPPVPFLVEHDWSAAFSKASEFDDGEVKLPFEFCMFEFRVCGHHICVYLTEGGVVGWFVEVEAGWLCGDVSDQVTHWQIEGDELNALLTDQVRAVCIALDAEVAEKETVRAPEKLQRSRTKRGKKPLSDYHVVRLTRRTRAAPLEAAGEPTGGHTRLHFVRGHWRHFDNHKTWIAWHLRGDPDLGFIDKHYRF